MKDNIDKILARYNLKAKEVLPYQKGYRNKSYPIILEDGLKVNLILYKNEPGIYERIKRTNLVSNYLSDKGFPTRKAYMLKNGETRLIASLNGQIRYLSLYNYLEGSTIPWEGYTMKHIKLLGKTMAEMHRAITNYELRITNFPKVTDELLELNSRMRKYFSDANVADALERKLNIKIDLRLFDTFEKLLMIVSKLPEQQVLHMDFVRSNILFSVVGSRLSENAENRKLTTDNLSISGILDFEKTALGPAIVDIARTLAFLIIDCKYKPEEKIRKYFLFSGYEKRGNSKIIHLKYLNPLVKFFLVHDFYKFLKHNPYEFLEQNEHFLRTRDKLLKALLLN